MNQQLVLFHPESAAQHRERDILLQKSLRPEPLPFPIAAEYPLVLSPAGETFSYCAAFAADPTRQIVAHANLWPRQLNVTRQGIAIGSIGSIGSIGLIGNVATDERHRGQGLMTALMSQLVERAQQQNLALLILWSDLDKFYQKLGFSSLGSEKRLTFQPHSWEKWQTHSRPFKHQDPSTLSQQDLEQMLRCRPSLEYEIKRSTAEFAQQLTIPQIMLFVQRRPDGSPSGYLVAGKGYDMVGVVHDWGCASAADLFSGVKCALDAGGWPEIMLLMPTNLPSQPTPWYELLEKRAVSTIVHPMALGHRLKMEPENKKSPMNDHSLHEALEHFSQNGFIWGLDSI